MNSQSPFIQPSGKKKEDQKPVPSRFIDEKISDENGAETKTNSALAPAGLKNPFWN